MTTGELWLAYFHAPSEPLAIFCAPVLGMREAIVVSVVGLVLFGGTLMTILRRIRVLDEKRRFANTEDMNLPTSPGAKPDSKTPPNDPTRH